MVDLSAITPVSRTIEIVHPATGAPLGIAITVRSIDDPALEKIKRQITDERLKLEQKNKAFKAESIEENRIKILMTAITGWRWYSPTGKDEDMPQYKGEVPDYLPVNVKAMLADREIRWFGDQINAEISETDLFFDK